MLILFIFCLSQWQAASSTWRAFCGQFFPTHTQALILLYGYCSLFSVDRMWSEVADVTLFLHFYICRVYYFHSYFTFWTIIQLYFILLFTVIWYKMELVAYTMKMKWRWKKIKSFNRYTLLSGNSCRSFYAFIHILVCYECSVVLRWSAKKKFFKVLHKNIENISKCAGESDNIFDGGIGL